MIIHLAVHLQDVPSAWASVSVLYPIAAQESNPNTNLCILNLTCTVCVSQEMQQSRCSTARPWRPWTSQTDMMGHSAKPGTLPCRASLLMASHQTGSLHPLRWKPPDLVPAHLSLSSHLQNPLIGRSHQRPPACSSLLQQHTLRACQSQQLLLNSLPRHQPPLCRIPQPSLPPSYSQSRCCGMGSSMGKPATRMLWVLPRHLPQLPCKIDSPTMTHLAMQDKQDHQATLRLAAAAWM